MLKYARDSIKYLEGSVYKDFISDEKNIVFAVFNLSQMGELVTKVDKSFRDRHGEIPWVELKSIRNRIVHDYEGVKYKIIWNILTGEMPELIKSFENMLDK